eukprot:7854255-Alexandrium_andersonii.AAC.1
MPANSASPELEAMVFCVVDRCLRARSARKPPRVDRLACEHPAKSASTYAWRVAPSSRHGKR